MTSGTRTVLCVALFFGGTAHAVTSQWRNTSGDGNWNNPANWLNGIVPGPADTASFNNATGGTVNITGGNASVNALTKSVGVLVTISGPGSLTVGAGGITRTGGGAASVLNITTSLIVGAAGETWTISGGTNTFSGPISGADFIKVGGGTLILSGANSFSAARVNAGTLQATTSSGLGGGTVTLAGGTLSFASAAALNLPVSVTTAGNATLNVQGGAVTHSVTSVTANAGNTLTVTSGGGAGVSVGTLSVNGTVAGAGPTLTVTGTLTGSGALNRAVTVAAGANLTPVGAGLTTGALTLSNTTNLKFTVGTTVTHLQVNGALLLDGVLTVSPGPGLAANTYNLMTATGAITDNHLQVPSASVPAGFNIGYIVSGAQVNLIVTVRALGLSVAKLQATYDSRHTQLAWTMRQEQNTLGYRLWKQDGSSRVQVLANLMPGGAVRMGTDLKNGPSYVLEDWKTSPGGTYWVEAVGMNGQSNWLGPVTARAGLTRQTSAPTADPARTPLVLSRGPASAQLFSRSSNLVAPNAGRAVAWALASAPAAKIYVRDSGVYRIPAQSLFNAGIPAGVALDSLKVSSLGQPVSFRALSADGAHLNPSDSIEFYGEGVDSRYTDIRVYWVSSTLGAGPQTAQLTETSGAIAGPSFAETLGFEDRLYYFGGLKNGGQQKFFGPWVYDLPEVRTYATPAIDLTSSELATLEVALQGVTTGQHAVQVSVNGVPIGEITGSGHQFMTGRFQLPSGLLVAGVNTVQLAATTSSDASFEAYQRLTYPRLYQSTGGPLHFTALGGTTVHLAAVDAQATSVLDITNPAATIALRVSADPADASASLVTVPGDGQRSLISYTEADLKTPVSIAANTPSTIHSGETDLIVIAHATLVANMQPLVAQRRREGLRVALVDVENVYDEFAYGQKDVGAIRDFLAYAAANWSRPPRYLLLVGSASFNPRNFGGAGGIDLVPTPLVETEYMETGSDDALVGVSELGSPNVAVGRLPLSDPNAVGQAVAKTLARALVNHTSTMLFVHDEDDPVSNFSRQTAEMRRGLSIWHSSEISRSNGLAEGSPQQAAADAALHDSLIEALVTGPAVVSYLGHGAEDLWSGSILSGEDGPALSSSSGASVLFAGACLNGFYVNQGSEFLAGALLSAPRGGAWAMIASSGATNPGEQSAFALSLFQASLFDGLTLGEALAQAKSGISDPDFRATFQLFGDPSARMTAVRPAEVPSSRLAGISSEEPTVTNLQSRVATGCGTPGRPLLAVIPLVALALVVATRNRRRTVMSRSRHR
jgi:hypothetical protein